MAPPSWRYARAPPTNADEALAVLTSCSSPVLCRCVFTYRLLTISIPIIVMPNLGGNPNAGSLLLEAIDAGVIQKFIVRDKNIGHFEVDNGKHLFILSARSSGSGWSVMLEPPLLQKLGEVGSAKVCHGQRALFEFEGAYLWIACGEERCELYPREWRRILDPSDNTTEQAIKTRRPPNCSFRVHGSTGRLSHTIPCSRFPSLAG